MKNAPVRHAVEAGGFQFVRGLVRMLPHRRSRSVGRALGTLAWHALPGRRAIALDNLALAMPELDDGERRRIARGAFRQMTSLAAELLSWDRFDATELCRRWTFDGWEHTALDDGQSAFYMTAHLGYWEMLGNPLSLYRAPVAALVRPLDNPRLDRFVTRTRTAYGLRVIEKHGAARELTRGLRDGTRFLVLIDQRVRPRDAVTVPFFGRPALTTNLIARLALKSGAPVVPVFACPEPGGRYRIVARPPIESGDLGSDPIAELTARYLAAVEGEIRRQPELWLWMHDRWRMP